MSQKTANFVFGIFPRKMLGIHPATWKSTMVYRVVDIASRSPYIRKPGNQAGSQFPHGGLDICPCAFCIRRGKYKEADTAGGIYP